MALHVGVDVEMTQCGITFERVASSPLHCDNFVLYVFVVSISLQYVHDYFSSGIYGPEKRTETRQR